MSQNFLLVGNAPNYNRGCEAIARGTMAILREVAGSETTAKTGIIAPSEVAAQQNKTRSDKEPVAFGISPVLRNGLTDRLSRRFLGSPFSYSFPDLAQHLTAPSAVLEIGGDNYSLDYGRPYTFLDLDRNIKSAGKPLAIWGASIGPFDADPKFEQFILNHFKTIVDHLFVRETASFEYLQQKGLTNISLMADPAIMMMPEKPKEITWDEDKMHGAIGLNLSTFQAKKFASGQLDYWQLTQEHIDALADFGAELVNWLVTTFNRPVLLVPHVMAPVHWNNDHRLLEKVLGKVDAKLRDQVQCLPPNLNAAELKWAISNCSVFAGSRTHSTIAAISTGVPLLAFGYSRKATGIMRDLYGHDSFCLPSSDFTADKVKAMFSRLVAGETDLREIIASKLPVERSSALAAGRQFVEMVSAA